MLLVQIKIAGVIRYISNEMCQLEHAYKPWVAGITAPSWSMDQEYGGMVRFGYGGLTISPGLFNEIGIWPPDVQCDITVLYTESTEATAVTLFESIAHLVNYNSDSVQYDIREKEYLEKLLNETVDYNGNDVALPRAFGQVTHVQPVRIADDSSSRPCYHLGGIVSSAVAVQILGFTSVSGGTETKIVTESAHGYSNGDTVYIAGTDNFDGGHVISDASGTSFVIPVAFANETMPINAQSYKTGELAVFDDGVPIPENVVINGDGTFSLTANPVGVVTIVGTGADTTVDQIADWVKTKLGISTYTSTYARSPSPSVSKWVTAQQTVVDFLSGLCSANTHLFYIKDDTLTLVDMYISNGNRTMTEYQFFLGVDYQKFNPLKKLIATWQTYSAETGFVNDDYSGGQSHYIKINDHEIEELLYDYGDEKSIEVYHENESNVRSSLICIRSIYEGDKASISIPFGVSLPVPGERLTWTDNNVPVPVPGYIRARDLAYDFDSHEVKITGDGLFIRTERAASVVNTSLSGATTVTIDSLDMALGHGAIWRYVIVDDDANPTNIRVGIIQAAWDQAAGGNVIMMPDHSTPDIGTTIGIVSFSVSKAATTVRLRATSTSGDWEVHVVRTIIGAN